MTKHFLNKHKLYLSVFFFLFSAIGHWLIFANYVLAADAYVLEVPLQGDSASASGPGEYIRLLFLYGLGIIGIVALFAIVFGGIRYVTSGSSETGKAEGKKWIIASLSGVILLFSSYLILNTINPNLVSLKEPNLPAVDIDVPEQPAQTILNLGQQTGALPGQLTFSNSKYPDMEQRFNETAPNNLRQVVTSIPIPVAITSYDQGTGHKANSDHYQKKAVDIYTGNMTDAQLKTVLDSLSSNPNVSKIITGRMSEYNSLNGQLHNYEKNDPGINQNHATHIHVSVY